MECLAHIIEVGLRSIVGGRIFLIEEGWVQVSNWIIVRSIEGCIGVDDRTIPIRNKRL